MRQGLHCTLRTAALTTAALATLVAHRAPAADIAPAADMLPTQLRRPVAMQLSQDNHLLYVANRRSGSLSVVDTARAKVSREVGIGEQLSDLVAVPKRATLLATDEAAHELVVLSVDGDSVAVAQRLAVASYPVSAVVSADGSRAVVASLWSRRLTFVDLPTEDAAARVAGTLDMPFAPRKQLLVNDDRTLLVGDSFGGRIAVVDCRSRKVLCVREIPGHNIRGLGVSANGKMLLVSHQMLNELAHTVRNDVHWGLLMSNDLRWLNLKSVLDGKSDLYKGAHMHPLGEAGRATADPAELAVARNGSVVVALAGVGEIALGKEDDFSLYRLRVGRRPTTVVISDDSRRAYVANTFDDSISVVDLEKRERVQDIPLGPQPELTLVDQGELLFFDARLSHDRWMSCHSCHTDGHTNGMLNDNFSDESFGAPKRVLSLMGRAGTEPLAWNGGAKDFATQIRKSIVNTMQSDQPPQDRQVAALAAFVKTLQSPPPVDSARGQRDDAAVARGAKLFESLRCNTCHAPPTYTTPRTYNVGLRDKMKNDQFNPPSLRGVGQRGPYFHDGRAKSLQEVFSEYRHRVEDDFSEEQLRDLVAFLRSL